MLCRSAPQESNIEGRANADHETGREPMNQIVYIVGLVVIALFILGFLGLR